MSIFTSLFAESYTDARVVEAYTSRPDKRVMQWWYEQCRRAFDTLAPGLDGLSEMDLDDLFHNSHILVWEKMEQGRIYADRRGRVVALRRDGSETPCASLTGYFVNTVRLKHLEMLRERRLTVYLPDDSPCYEDTLAELYADTDPEVETDRIVSQALLSLPRNCIEILTMFYYDRLTLDEILVRRPESGSYDGLKTRKWKCMSTLRKRIDEKLRKASLR